MRHFQMVKHLKEVIANLPDDMPVLLPGGDHEYRIANFGVGEVWHNDPKRPGQATFEECDVDGATNTKALIVS